MAEQTAYELLKMRMARRDMTEKESIKKIKKELQKYIIKIKGIKYVVLKHE